MKYYITYYYNETNLMPPLYYLKRSGSGWIGNHIVENAYKFSLLTALDVFEKYKFLHNKDITSKIMVIE